MDVKKKKKRKNQTIVHTNIYEFQSVLFKLSSTETDVLHGSMSMPHRLWPYVHVKARRQTKTFVTNRFWSLESFTCLRTSTSSWWNKKMYTCCTHAAEDGLRGFRMWNWQDTAEVCCYFIPRLTMKEVHDPAGTLLRSTVRFNPPYRTVSSFLWQGDLSQTRGSQGSLRQSHLKSETGQRKKNISKSMLIFLCLKNVAGQWHLKWLFLDFSAPVTLRYDTPQSRLPEWRKRTS